MSRTGRKDNYMTAGILSYVCSLLQRIPLLYIMGERGIAYFSFASELYVLAGCLFTCGLSAAVSQLVRYRVRREQYKNADRVLRSAVILALCMGIAVGAFLLALHAVIARYVIGLPLAGLAICMISPALVFQLLTGVFRGYFEGSGSRVPTAHSIQLETLMMIIGGLMGASLLHKYGIKVSALLQNDNYAGAYGAMGAALGILTAALFGFLHMLFVYFVYRRKTGKQAAMDATKNQDKGSHIIHMLIGTAAPFAAYAVLYRITPLLDGIFFVRLSAPEEDTAYLWGTYYGKYLPVIGTLCLLMTLTGISQVKRILYYTDREEFRMARERLALVIHQLALWSVPAAIFTAVFAKNIMNLIFSGNNEEGAYYAALGSILIVLFGFASLFSDILIRLKKMNLVIIGEGAALAVHILLLILLLKSTALSVIAVVIANIISFAILAVWGFLLVQKRLQYRQEWLHAIAFTLVDGAVAGLLGMLLQRGLSAVLPDVGTLLIGLPVSGLAYMVLLIITHAVSEKELENMALGRILIFVGKRMKMM
jgi:stage V sporulation protein B